MNRYEIQLLQNIRANPCVTITMPSHRTSPDNKQDPIRLKNLVAEATDRLLRDFSKRELEPLLKRLEQTTAEIDHEHNLEGLALFVNRDFARVYRLPFPLPERVVIDETFATRDLVYALNRTVRYWAIALAEKPTRLFAGTNDVLVEVTEGEFPLTPEPPSRAALGRLQGRTDRVGEKPDLEARFIEQLDDAFEPFHKQESLPIVLIGVERLIGAFRKHSRFAGAVVLEIRGNHDSTSAHDLGKLIEPRIGEIIAERGRQALSELEAAVGARRCASTIGEVWRYAHEGRGATLLVEQSYHAPARIDATGLHLLVAEDTTPPEVIDDAVDDVIETVIRMGGRVVFVPDGTLREHGRIALVLRY
ncbi:MAG: hypothetical protein RMM31_07920 [Anaerolineae bacterium]|nr:hypothetical protein [Anaerolineae bacterium]